MTDTHLTIDGLHKGFGGRPVLRGVRLAVSRGESVAVVGPSGCGKTTLLRVIAGFETPESGTVTLGERVIVGGERAVSAHRRGVGYVAQDGALFPHLTVGGNVGFGLARRERSTERIAELLERVALDPGTAGLRPDQLSGGQQQRVAVARALAQSPDLVLLDEPFSALDAGLRGEIRAGVAEVLHSAGVTSVLVTHDHEEALSFADRVAVMRDGEFAQVSRPREVYLAPVDEDVARFFGEVVRLPARVSDGVAVTPLGAIPVAGDAAERDRVWVRVRTEQILLRPEGSDGTPGRVGAVTFLGPTVRCEIEVTGVGAVVARCRPQDAPEAGTVVAVSVVGPCRTAE